MRFVFSDGEKLGVYSDVDIKNFDSNYILNYIETATRDANS